MSDTKKLIVVLGAHRSGTSLCAAAVVGLGADACLGEHYANDENSKGFFEHPDIVDFNDRLLDHLGGSWDNPLFDGAEAMAGADLQARSDEALELFQEIYGGAPIAVIKDPRICQLLPFWLPLFSRAGYLPEDVLCIHTLRDPVEVALSQRSRALANPTFYEFGRTLAEGAVLWLSLTAQALEHGGEQRTYYLTYADLVQQGETTLRALADFLELPARDDAVARFCNEFVDASLYRSAADADARAELAQDLPQAGEFFEAAQSLRGTAEAQALERCLAIWRRADTRTALHTVSVPALSRLSTRCRSAGLALQRSEESVADLHGQVSELQDNTQRIQREHQDVVVPLRQQLRDLESGNTALQSQLVEQAAELEKVIEENRRTVHELLERAGSLEQDKLQLTGEVQDLGNRIGEMEMSTSWRVTRPLRSLSLRLQQLRAWQASQWVRFRLRAILIYHRMSLRQPALAYGIRRLVRPFFRLMNRVAHSAPNPALAASSAGLLTPMRYQQVESSEEFAPLISVIVPNYNHAPYLELRLDSIFSQTYQNFEVILLDDASSDDSADILRDYHARFADKSTLVVNEQNSGGVFHQWERGLNLARGDIVWIAESDDWCTENFLETLVPYFENEAVQIAYARTVFMDGEGDRQIWSINEYLHDIDPQRWNHSIVATAPAIVREAFAVKNIIPNVSSALMRNPRRLEILHEPDWRRMRTCGDWVLYLHLLRGGMLAYSPAACNYYRMHGSNTSVSSYSQDEFYCEHEVVARHLLKYYDVPLAAIARLRENLAVHWRETRGEFSDAALERCFSLARIEEAAGPREPNLLMASYAFCSGGGETFPITLANIMKASGYNVTYLDCAREPRVEGVRRRLRPDIGVVSDFTQLERIVADFEIDVIHSHHAWMDSTIFEVLPEDSDCKVVVTSHGMYETINEYDLRPILPRLVQRSSAIIYVAEKNLEALGRHGLLGRARLERIDNALEPESFEPVERASLGIDASAFVLTLVSRGLPDKGWQEAIDAVNAVRDAAGCDVHLVLVGDGLEYDRLSATELPPHIHLEGFQENVRGYFALADMGFLPSRFRGESFPLVIIECLLSGRPFLASDLGEIRRMLDSEAGMAGAVVPLRGDDVDIEGMVEQITTVARQPDVYSAMLEAVPAAAGKFDPALLARRHDEVYRSVLRGEEGYGEVPLQRVAGSEGR
ncbi:glycosyltransferase [Mangrovimicrobium sediminis]|uniref:Glycosyltransferase n=1 Tax=Mangrovimicrobium sediminis TaxID=2562682 RepID=A0A4Z0M466_9GAMM|nr:glycosyltransferase [Haliea sp. SAOS-164]TGD74095.1 glycosyltransferase [Haliea sp. SAOS-164]